MELSWVGSACDNSNSPRVYTLSPTRDTLLSETKTVSCERVRRLTTSLGYRHMHCVPARGKAGGLLICWKSSVNLSIVATNEYLINCLVLESRCGTNFSW